MKALVQVKAELAALQRAMADVLAGRDSEITVDAVCVGSTML